MLKDQTQKKTRTLLFPEMAICILRVGGLGSILRGEGLGWRGLQRDCHLDLDNKRAENNSP